MEALYDLPNGDRVRVIDTTTVGQSLGRVLELFRSGHAEPVFFGDSPRPEGVVISFEQWAEYETLKEDAETDRRMQDLTRERLANARPEDYVPYDDMLREWGLDEKDGGGDKR
ncbi:hypothetical protein ACFV9C_28845 [Kribbella sp. NPDC059898]|uniref:hypothetical protein n=1 Tax=Kribbella sp. NPDC059898 TaxID=3346995 RepID=UPI0036564452